MGRFRLGGSNALRSALREALRPLRELAGRAVLLPPEESTIIGKAASFVVSERIGGDYLEFGVYMGNSLAQAFHVFERTYRKEIRALSVDRPDEAESLRKLWDSMRFVGFDSFEGLPALEGIDALTKDFRRGQFACSEEDFWKNLEMKRVDQSKVACVPGWFDETLTETTRKELGLGRAAVVHIDCDLYTSAKLALDFVTPLLQDGTILIFDDWYNYRGHPRLGERRALAEWAESHPEWILTEYQKQGSRANSFIVNDASIG